MTLDERASRWADMFHRLMTPSRKKAWYEYRIHDWLMAAWLAGYKAGRLRP